MSSAFASQKPVSFITDDSKAEDGWQKLSGELRIKNHFENGALNVNGTPVR